MLEIFISSCKIWKIFGSHFLSILIVIFGIYINTSKFNYLNFDELFHMDKKGYFKSYYKFAWKLRCDMLLNLTHD